MHSSPPNVFEPSMKPPDRLDSLLANHGGKADFLLKPDRYEFSSDEEAITVLIRALLDAISRLEGNSPNHQDSNEEALSDIICMQLEAAGFNASRGNFSGGETDILVKFRARPRLQWIAESKIHSSITACRDGLKQLVSRYWTRQEKHGAVLLFRKSSLQAKAVAQWRKDVPNSVRYVGPTEDFSERQNAFSSVHQHDDGTLMTVLHLPIGLYFNPQDKPGLDNQTLNARRESGFFDPNLEEE